LIFIIFKGLYIKNEFSVIANHFFPSVIRHFDEVWLKESWATYMEAVWTEHRFGTDLYRYTMYWNSNTYRSECKKKYTRHR
jgi:hypothetical protein